MSVVMRPRPGMVQGDGEGSLQVHLDPAIRIDTARSPCMARAGSAEHDLVNLSVAFSRIGKRVLQIGCDPKHDSTFTLTSGSPPP